MNETQQLENYLLGTLSLDDGLIMEARLIIDTELGEKALWQQRTYSLIKDYGRKKLKIEIEKAHVLLFSDKKFIGFRQKIKNIFK